MSLDFTGIVNQQEFYPPHYLQAILEGDLKGVFAGWEEAAKGGEVPPPERLKDVARSFHANQRKLEKTGELAGEWWGALWGALGYRFEPKERELEDGALLSLQAEERRADGAPWLWILDASACEDEDPIDYFEARLTAIFGLNEPPRWVLLADTQQVILLDRLKWSGMRNLRFELPVIFERQDTSTLRLMVALLHRDSLCPGEGSPLLDTLTDNAHKHAHGVSQELKYALRASIELLGNEAVFYLREVRKEKVFGTDLSQRLTLECLRYMYRLLFLFYIEARPELGYAPIKSDAYLKGYSLEHLRDLELVPLTTENARNGTYFHESLDILFGCIYDGFAPRQADLYGTVEPFRLVPLKTHLFDPSLTPTLNKVRFRNHVLQKVIELMSLSSKRGFRDRRGRISYAQLGINQLGAVYEALLSFKGWFAEDDLYEVQRAEKPARGTSNDEDLDGEEAEDTDAEDTAELAAAHGGDARDADYRSPRLLDQAFFVKAVDLPKYRPEEKVLNSDGSLKKYPKGTFIYRLSGRAREKSASYYTPEVLTECLVKYALKVLLEGKTADEILQLTVCEPAMGSAAFLNEAINQLAEAYLERKEAEMGERVPAARRLAELQKIKMLIGDNNVFGVDLNPVAVELAEVSLWLNTIVGAADGAFVPWFGMQLTCGNSLIGARRQVFEATALKYKKKADPSWLNTVPVRVLPGTDRPESGIYHWLLPDEGMAFYDDKVIKGMAPAEIKELNERRKEFIKPFSDADIEQLKALSMRADILWDRHATLQADIRKRTTDPLQVWGQPESPKKEHLSTREKDDLFDRSIRSLNESFSSPYSRLKLAMDYWCALWFWPIEKADLFPSRDEYLMELSFILKGEQYISVPAVPQQQGLFGNNQSALSDGLSDTGVVNIVDMCRRLPRLRLVQEIAQKLRFLHWEVEFADLFAAREGFDLILGNPPWLKVEWDEGGVMGDAEPIFVLRRWSAAELANERATALEQYGSLRKLYLEEFEESSGTQAFLNGYQNYSLLQGMQTNLFKCFLPQAWWLNRMGGVSGFIHPEGIYDDPKGGAFRAEMYQRLRAHFQFQNQLMLFPIGHRLKYSINIFGLPHKPRFRSIANLFTPKTIDACLNHHGDGEVGGIKMDDGKGWNFSGHKARLIEVGLAELELFAQLYDKDGTPSVEARLPALHSQQLLDVLKKFSAVPQRLGNLAGHYLALEMWHETNAQKDGTICRETGFPNGPAELVLSGPHYYVATPFYKTPRRICTEKAHYDVLDLTSLPDDYLPRTNYRPAVDYAEYRRRTPAVPWGSQKPVTDFYRLICRRQLGQSGERTLKPIIGPREAGHIDGSLSVTIDDTQKLVELAGTWASIPFDFFVKSSGKSDIRHELARQLPLLAWMSDAKSGMAARVLALNCLTSAYADLWTACWEPAFTQQRWTKADTRLDDAFFANLTPKMNHNCALRTDYARRQALVEIDVLVSQALYLTLDELQTIYRIQFPVLRQNEQDTWYDRKGRIVFTCSKGLTGVGFTRQEWNAIKDMPSGTVSRTMRDDTQPGGPRERTIIYEAPFDRCDREQDYATTWAAFEARLGRRE